MQFIERLLKSLPEYEQLRKSVQNSITVVGGVAHIHKMAILYSLVKERLKNAILITVDEPEAIRAQEDLLSLGIDCCLFPMRDFSPRNEVAHGNEYEQKRIGTLSKLLDGDFGVCIIPVDAAVSRTIPPKELKEKCFNIKMGDTIDTDTLIQKLINCAYTRMESVEAEGQFSVRGGIVDIFSPGEKSPCRIDFWGDEIDTISAFDIETQRRTETINEIKIVPVKECIIDNPEEFCEKLEKLISGRQKFSDEYKENVYSDIDLIKSGLFRSTDKYLNLIFGEFSTVLDYFSGAVFISDFSACMERIKGATSLMKEDFIRYIEDGLIHKKTEFFLQSKSEFLENLRNRTAILLENFPKTRYELEYDNFISFNLKQTMPISVSSKTLYDELENTKTISVVLAGNERAANSLCLELNENGIAAIYCKETSLVGEKGVFITVGGLSAGFESADGKFKVITHGSSIRTANKRRFKKGADIGSLEQLKKGDYVVHISHGIGIFDGVIPMTMGGITKDYIKINYQGKDVLYVPVTSLDLVSKYIGSKEDSIVKINRLGSPKWKNARQKVRSAVKDIAKQLTALYAKRMNSKGYAFSPDSEMQKDFEMRFKYQETDDQIVSADEIKRDMEKPFPMDRLLCGDVGFGKTEVALRAAFKCILDGKQCAVLVPTTILAWQHFMTATERFGNLPVNIEMISRFRTEKQQTKIKKDLKAGAVDLIIGTHRLVSKDIEFHDLGLLIVDEEQRFGVEQKEKLKEKFPAVDVLTLSATPIPRTLNMALSGLRDMSSIEEAPLDRMPVQTYVLEQEESVIIEAINKELRRGGQVFYLHNRVDSIERRAIELKRALPDSNIGVAHGKMSEDELSKVWKDMLEQKIDILVCTTIIETGVDLPNANTLIIEDADRMGLSQLHQLRGRVGRSHRRAFAYLLFKRGKALSDISQKRLTAIREFTEFGSGFKIAMRDLEIRGAGNVLGGEQHGHMEAVGYDLYIKMLKVAISEEKGEAIREQNECSVDLRINAHIPEDYIEGFVQRISIYRRIAGIKDEQDLSDVLDELIDRFGEPPKAVEELLSVAILRANANDLGISDIIERMGRVVIYFKEFSPEYLTKIINEFKNDAFFKQGEKPYLSVKINSDETALSVSKRIINTIK